MADIITDFTQNILRYKIEFILYLENKEVSTNFSNNDFELPKYCYVKQGDFLILAVFWKAISLFFYLHKTLRTKEIRLHWFNACFNRQTFYAQCLIFLPQVVCRRRVTDLGELCKEYLPSLDVLHFNENKQLLMRLQYRLTEARVQPERMLSWVYIFPECLTISRLLEP